MPDQFRNGIGRALNGEQSGGDAAHRRIRSESSYSDLDKSLEEFDEGLRTDQTSKAGGRRYTRKIRHDTAHEEPWGVLKERSCYSGDNDSANECAQKIGNNYSSDLNEADGILAIVKAPVAGILNVDSEALREVHEKTGGSGR